MRPRANALRAVLAPRRFLLAAAAPALAGVAALAAQGQGPAPTHAAARDGAVHGGPTLLLGAPFTLEPHAARELVKARSPRVLTLFPKGGGGDATEGAGAGAAAIFASLAPEVDARELDPEDRTSLDARGWAETLARADAVVLSGGTYLEWHKLLTPQGKPTRLDLELHAFHDRGGCVAGAGAAAGFLAAWTILERDLLEKPRRDPHDRDVHVLVGGLGFVPGICVQPASGAAGSAAELIEVVRRFHVERAVSLDPRSAWIHDPTSAITTIEGAGTSVFIDVSRAQRSRETVRGGRILVLRSGDRLDTRRARLLGERLPLERLASGEAPPSRSVADAWSHAALAAEAAAFDPLRAGGMRVLLDARFRLHLALDEDGAAIRDRSGPSELRFDLEPRTP